ncbi:phosphotransferase [bacterium]|nr:phosphotransferase [bacterium]
MWELTAENAVDYLRKLGQTPTDTEAIATPLAWGVSNLVLRIDGPTQPSIVLKQSQPQLRTKIEWLSRCERIYREADVLRATAPLLPDGAIPRVLFEDREHYVLGLEAIRADHVVWKAALLQNHLDLNVARTLGAYLGTIHRQTAGRSDLLPDASDWSLFDELRIDPFYRWIARVHSCLQPAVDRLLSDMAAHRVCLVLADFSPKNVLVHADGVSLVDFETGHYGDPAFDLGFFLSHLLLKSLRGRAHQHDWQRLIIAFWNSYRETVDHHPNVTVMSTATSARAVAHLAGCLLARVDGKSPVDYLNESWQADFVRQISFQWFDAAPATLEHAWDQWFALLPQAHLPS